jgi:hypothetical protein
MHEQKIHKNLTREHQFHAIFIAIRVQSGIIRHTYVAQKVSNRQEAPSMEATQLWLMSPILLNRQIV